MAKSTRDVSTCFVFKSYPEAFISPLFFNPPPPPPRERCSLTLFGLHLDFYLATPLHDITVIFQLFGSTFFTGFRTVFQKNIGELGFIFQDV